ncbi:MAG: LPXTG cell wall anchor domain-containing protein [Eubacterium sp.]|nr:LPXTG cell wall anchor domain-containing protein [Eubacterium sp.]
MKGDSQIVNKKLIIKKIKASVNPKTGTNIAAIGGAGIIVLGALAYFTIKKKKDSSESE